MESRLARRTRDLTPQGYTVCEDLTREPRCRNRSCRYSIAVVLQKSANRRGQLARAAMLPVLRRVAARPHAIAVRHQRRKFSVFDWWRENVIKPIHGTRIKLPDVLGVPAATYMQFVYPVPVVVGGYYVMQWAIGRSHASIGPRGERLRERPGCRPDAGADEQRAQLQRILDEARRRKAGD